MVTAASDFLIAAAEFLALGIGPEPIRAMLDRACDGKLNALAADGSRASGLTVTGIPFEASVSGGRGRLTAALRYVTESGTEHIDFDSRLTTATPMKLVRLFGDPAWELQSELVRCGADAATLYQFPFLISCGRRGNTPTFALQLGARRRAT
ncbi:hypothetical protein [Nocardia acidivorans]|uniref:hypothetical protein n=1 Tax=Nocardia acidivorans TaxID=404580 RepID=UPI0008300E3A|nr:hypothetical protein [Nocardia acidivorans]